MINSFSFNDLLYNGYFFLYNTYKIISDRQERQIIEKYVKPGDIVLDIGANIGSYCVYLSTLVGESGHVYAFEPSPRNFSRLTKIVNSIKNVTIQQSAVGNFTGKSKLFLSNLVNTDHQLYQTNEKRTCVEVDCIRLDDYFNKDQRVDFIKMDIQGFEYHAFLGMYEVLKCNQDIKFIFEFWPLGLRDAGIAPLDVIKWLRDQGFYLYVIEKDKLADFSEDRVQYGALKYFNILGCREALV